MFKIGDKVRLNIQDLEDHFWADLEPEFNSSNKDYKSYILSNPDKVYTISNFEKTCPMCPYQLNDEFMKETSFAAEELIKVE